MGDAEWGAGVLAGGEGFFGEICWDLEGIGDGEGEN